MTNDIQKVVEETEQMTLEAVDASQEMLELLNKCLSDMEALVAKSVENTSVGNQMMSAAEKQQASSEQAMNITDMILSISDQTNLLSLNASIEAARAGEAGRGFAVVATEVSQLAGQTQQAAQNTANLIGDSIRTVGDGITIANNTAEELNKMVSQVEEIRGRVKQISEASVVQAESVQELSTNIDKIAEEGTNNAATSEESLALSSEMSEHADSLKSMVDHFELKN